uniref:ERF1_1 domain-containing protein n=1 Tax=Ascaris lumbricoides TaxID=6252 RepID=A0A0M3I8N7_ASCLU
MTPPFVASLYTHLIDCDVSLTCSPFNCSVLVVLTQTTPAFKTAERGRVLTMKYGKHQMMLIRKRMAVENWLDDRLVQLCDGTVELDIDLDKVLDLNTTTERRRYILVSHHENFLSDRPKSALISFLPLTLTSH